MLLGDTLDGSWYASLMREAVDVEPIREHLLFGRALVEALHGSPVDVSAAA